MMERMTVSESNRRRLLTEFKWEEVRKRTLELLKKHNIDYVLVSEDGKEDDYEDGKEDDYEE